MGVLKKKTAIITGGASGIGREIAKRFFEEGANIILFDLNKEKLTEAKGGISKNNERIITVRGDVREEEDILRAVTHAKKLGGVDILVNCAGVLHFGKLDQTEPSVWDRLMRINVFGPWRFMVAVLPAMRERGGGSIVNISSINGIKAFPGAGIYCTSKAALQMMSQVMAMETAEDNIRVNMILPGLVEDTGFLAPVIGGENVRAFSENLRPIHPLGRNAKPKDIAGAALFLASDQNSFITGVMLNVDGGRHMATNRPPSA